MIDVALAEGRTAVTASSPPTAMPARRAWRQALALVVRAGGWTAALYRRWDARQERRMHLATERDNVHLLFPRV